MPFHTDIFQLTKNNTFYRKEIVTGSYSQVVIMCLKPEEQIGMEVHKADQTLIFVQGVGEAILNGEASLVKPGDLVFVPAGTQHNFINTGIEDLKLFTLYAPPQHKPGTLHKTKAEALNEKPY